MDRGAVDLPGFNLRPKCSKCLGERFSWKHTPTGAHMEHTRSCPEVFGDKGEHLDLTCERCGYTVGMKTANDR